MIQDFAILIHGINPDLIPGDSIEALDGFLATLCQDDEHLSCRFPPERVIPIRWGHPQQGRPDEGASFSRDEQLFVAQNRILQVITAVEPELTPDDYLPWSRAQVAIALQRTLLISGIGDVVYFTGSDGYRTIQRIVFRQLQQRIQHLLCSGQLDPSDTIRLHLFAESLGVSISYEFLALLFGPRRLGHALSDLLDSDMLSFFQRLNHTHSKSREHPTTQADGHTFVADGAPTGPAFIFGSFIAAASQLPLLLQRRQHAIEELARGDCLDPAHIGVHPSCDCPRWLLFHDPRDILSLIHI